MNDVRYASFDPGETTGWVTWDESGEVIERGQVRGREALLTLLESLSPFPTVMIVEDWRLMKSKALQQSGNRQETVRVIGALETVAMQRKCKFVLQPASILATTQLQSGVSMKGNHDNSHWKSAYNHGFHYLVKQGVRKLTL